jgi:peptidoglycan hydrolase CwlO-like protein
MADGGGSPPTPGQSAVHHREARWMGQGYADITKLRELAAKHERASTRNQQRAARLNTRIEKIRHSAAVLREKAQAVLARIPDLESEMGQHEKDIKARTDKTGGISLGSDVTELQFRIRKLQQKIVDLRHKSRTLEHRAATKTQKTAELKVKVDRYLEASKLEEQEGLAYRQRADRLQMATQGEVASHLSGTPEIPPPEAPGDSSTPR